MPLIRLGVLKHSPLWKATTKLFKLSCYTIDRQITKFYIILFPITFEKFVQKTELC